jgi:MFS superfamily sulfate permease-like transporter
MSTTTIRTSQRANRLTRFIPIVAWLPRYDRAWLSLDVIAGLTLWGLVVPEAMAYAGIASLPPQAGLYTLVGLADHYACWGPHATWWFRPHRRRPLSSLRR